MKNKSPIRIIEGSMNPFEPFWQFRDVAQGESGEVELEFFGPISEYSWWGDEVTPAMFKNELYQKGKGNPVTVLVNSPGGEVIAASMIRSILQDYPGTITMDIIGLAASAATVMVTGGDHVRMRESALFMIHDPSGVAWGNIDEIKGFLETLKTVKDSIIDTYQTKTGIDRDKLAKMMTDETWLTAREAKEMNFVDEVVTESIKKPKAVGFPVGFSNCLSNYLHVPEELKTQLSEPVNSAVEQPEISTEERRLRDEIRLLKGAKA